MSLNLTEKQIATHLSNGEMIARSEIDLMNDQTPTQDATGTLVILEFEAMQLDRVRTELSVQCVDHNLSFDINPASRQELEILIRNKFLEKLVHNMVAHVYTRQIAMVVQLQQCSELVFLQPFD